jgi:hypothetical protein
MIPRGRKPIGELKRREQIHALFTNDQKQRVIAAATAQNMTVSTYVYHVVMDAVSAAA